MPTPTDSFQFDYYLVDYLPRLVAQLVLDGYRPSRDMQTLLEEIRTALDKRDTDLEDYLGLGTFAPAIGVSRTATQSVNHNALTPIGFDTLDFQSTDVIEWDGATKLTVKADGIVSVVGNLRYASASPAAGVRAALIHQNLSEITASVRGAITNVQERIPLSDIVAVLAGDEFTLNAYQTQGAAVNVEVAKLRIVYLGQTG